MLTTPLVGLQKVNWDVAIDKVNGHMGMGVIVQDHEGHVLVAKSFTQNPKVCSCRGLGNPT